MFRTLVLVGVLLSFGLVPGGAQEKLTLTTPVSQPTITDYRSEYLGISSAAWTMTVQLKPNTASANNITCTWGTQANNKGLVCSHGFTSTTAPSGFASAELFIRFLNTANMSTAGNSLNARIYNQLILDGAFTGTVTP